jgi:predicted O-methyltransferase YrrM
MNRLARLGPYLYLVLHSYNSAWELLLTRSVREKARRDSERLRQRFPALNDYARSAARIRQRLAAEYQDYTSTVSPGTIAISLELAIFLTALCELSRPRAILDLGSGFSSYVFRRYARESGVSPPPLVYSIDDSEPWLNQTRRFLQRRDLDPGNLYTWSEFVAREKPAFDLVLQDLGDLGTRLRVLNAVLESCAAGGMMVIDDMHVPGYRRAVLEELNRRGLSHFSLRSFTRKRMRYSYLVTR